MDGIKERTKEEIKKGTNKGMIKRLRGGLGESSGGSLGNHMDGTGGTRDLSVTYRYLSKYPELQEPQGKPG